MHRFQKLQEEAIQLYIAKVPADSEQGQRFAENYWKMITEFTGGDLSMISKLVEIGKFEGTDPKWQEKQAMANEYVGQVLDVYFSRLGVNPFQEGDA